MKPLRVVDCPLCRIFSHKELKTKLYWPEKIEDIETTEFAIVNCQTCGVPMIVLGEHVTTITRECWGRILYRCRRIFGGGITLRKKRLQIFDHWHCHIYNIDKRNGNRY